MNASPQIGIPAAYMRGGTSKGVFFSLDSLPTAMQRPGPMRDRFLLRVMGSPDPYGKQIDGMGGASSSTSKVVLLSPSEHPDHDIDYLFGQVAIDQHLIDWSGNCGNLTAAVGPFAIANGLVDPTPCVTDGVRTVRIWQQNIGKTILAHVPVRDGRVQESGTFVLDGVAFPAAEIAIDFLDPGSANDGGVLPTGNAIDHLNVPGIGPLQVSLINAGIPTVFVRARDLGYLGTELQADINTDAKALAVLECVRAHGACKMGLIDHVEAAASRPHTPKIVLVESPADYMDASGKWVSTGDVNLLARGLSMGQLHHAMMGTAAVAIGVAAAVPGTVVNQVAGNGATGAIRFGHPSGVLHVGAHVVEENGQWRARSVRVSRSARLLMQGHVYVPAEIGPFEK